MEAFATSLNDAIASTVSKLQPFISQVQTTVTEKTEFLQPYLTEAKTVCFEYIELAQPHVAVVLEKTAPLWILMAQAQDKLPEFEEYSINTVAIAAIVLHVLFYNAIAHLEYNTKLFTTVDILRSLQSISP